MATTLSVLCSFCGNHDLLAMEEDERHYVMCTVCFACGPVADTAEVAMLSWCERHEEKHFTRSARLVAFSA